MANGSKSFTNSTNQPLKVTLFVRQGDSPGNEAGTVIFQLDPGKTQTQAYGSDTNSVFLDGILLEVVQKGSAYDNLMNTNSKIKISGDGSNITLTGSN